MSAFHTSDPVATPVDAVQLVPTCPTPCKVPHASRRAALGFAKRAKHLKAGQLRPYQCRCGAWHLTSMNKRESKKAARRLAA